MKICCVVKLKVMWLHFCFNLIEKCKQYLKRAKLRKIRDSFETKLNCQKQLYENCFVHFVKSFSIRLSLFWRFVFFKFYLHDITIFSFFITKKEKERDIRD